MNAKIMVDKVLASCFADFHHELAYSVMIPMQTFSELKEMIFGNEAGFPVYVSTADSLVNCCCQIHNIGVNN